jgi:hypothetical protein
MLTLRSTPTISGSRHPRRDAVASQHPTTPKKPRQGTEAHSTTLAAPYRLPRTGAKIGFARVSHAHHGPRSRPRNGDPGGLIFGLIRMRSSALSGVRSVLRCTSRTRTGLADSHPEL